MVAALLSPPPNFSVSTSSFTSNVPFSRSHNLCWMDSRKWRFLRRSHVVASSSVERTSGISFRKRELVLLGLCSSTSLIFPSYALSASSDLEEDVKMEQVVDDLNAYTFLFPTELPSKNFIFKWIVSRKPERYSSAAPLSPDARQRIVSERVDMINNLVISVSIGPPNPNFITSNDKSVWTAKAVSDSVLADKSALRVSSSQRLEESSVLDAHASNVDGDTYWYCEYLVRKSPTKSVQDSNLFRHYVASTAERDGYLYSLNASTLSKQWPTVGPFLQKTVDSFRLLPPTENYVPPYKDPWRFW